MCRGAVAAAEARDALCGGSAPCATLRVGVGVRGGSAQCMVQRSVKRLSVYRARPAAPARAPLRALRLHQIYMPARHNSPPFPPPAPRPASPRPATALLPPRYLHLIHAPCGRLPEHPPPARPPAHPSPARVKRPVLPLPYQPDTSRPSPRTNRTRRVPHPVLIGHAASHKRPVLQAMHAPVQILCHQRHPLPRAPCARAARAACAGLDRAPRRRPLEPQPLQRLPRKKVKRLRDAEAFSGAAWTRRRRGAGAQGRGRRGTRPQ